MESTRINSIMSYMKQCTVAEVVTLVKTLEKEFNVSAQPEIIEIDPVVNKKTEFDVELTAFGEQKVQVIKILREMTGLGLKEAKAMVEQAPVVIMKDIAQVRAEEVKALFEKTGAVISLK